MLKRAEGDGEGFIVIDDLVDTGGTAAAIREMYPKAHFVTIFAKPAGRPLVNDYVVDIPQDTWIEQPWDMGAWCSSRRSLVANLKVFNAWQLPGVVLFVQCQVTLCLSEYSWRLQSCHRLTSAKSRLNPALNTLKRQRWFVVLITARSRPYNLPWMVNHSPLVSHGESSDVDLRGVDPREILEVQARIVMSEAERTDKELTIRLSAIAAGTGSYMSGRSRRWTGNRKRLWKRIRR